MITVEKHTNQKILDKLAGIEKFVGNTPLYPLHRFSKNKQVRIWAKLEWNQLGQSVKARPAFNIVKQAVLNGEVSAEKPLLDATSGNTGIAYGVFGAALGIPVVLCLPENASEERKTILKALGVKLILTSKFESTDGAQEAAKELVDKHPGNYYYADQYANDHNWEAHYASTGPEIYAQSNKEISHFIAGLGTTGTFMGTGKRLKEFNNQIQLIGLQPDSALHGLEGWKHLETAKVPKIFDRALADDFRSVSTEAAYKLIKEVASCEGLLLSPSAAANLHGAIELSGDLKSGTIVTVFADNSDKYSEVYNQLF